MSDDKKKKKFKKFTKKPDLKEIKEMVDTQGLTKNTLKKKEGVERSFNTSAETFDYKNLDELCKEDCKKEDLETAICSFFDSFTVGEEELVPKKNYIDSIKMTYFSTFK